MKAARNLPPPAVASRQWLRKIIMKNNGKAVCRNRTSVTCLQDRSSTAELRRHDIPSAIRTRNPFLRREVLCPLSYGNMEQGLT